LYGRLVPRVRKADGYGEKALRKRRREEAAAAAPMRKKLIKWKLSGCTVAVMQVMVPDP